jgi:hypothetical protein
MSANVEQHADRLLVLRVGGELKKSELDTVQSEFVQKSSAPERSSFSYCWKLYRLGTRRAVGRYGLFLQPPQRL